MANRTLEMLLNKVELKETGSSRKAGQHIVITTLIWPRPLIAERVNAKTLQIEGNIIDLEKEDWITRIICKERVDGPFGVEFAVTEKMSDSQIADFLSFLGSSLMKLAGNEAEDLMTSSIAGGLIKIPFQHMSKLISKIGDKAPKIIARGSTCLHSEETWKAKNTKAKTFKVPLTAPETIYQTTRTQHHGTIQSRRRTIMKGGAENGMIEFTGKVYG